MSRKIYHVTKTDSGWKGKFQGAERATTTGATKAEVLDNTIRVAKKQGNTQVIVHKQNGRFQEERTYPKSSDPRSTKG